MDGYIINIEYGAVIIMGLGLGLMWLPRIISGKGTGVRVIQYTTLVLALPILLVLTLEGKISGETTITLIGTISGYTLSSLSEDRNENKTKTEKTP